MGARGSITFDQSGRRASSMFDAAICQDLHSHTGIKLSLHQAEPVRARPRHPVATLAAFPKTVSVSDTVVAG